MATATESGTWVFKSHARRLLGVGPAKLDHLIASGVLGVRQIPGCFARVRLADVEALLEASTRPATATAGRPD
jgi:hypothetical protein